MVKATIWKNKNNSQYLVFLSKKKFSVLKKREPKYLNIREEDIEF